MNWSDDIVPPKPSMLVTRKSSAIVNQIATTALVTDRGLCIAVMSVKRIASVRGGLQDRALLESYPSIALSEC